MILTNKKEFSIIVLISALILSVCSAYYSVIGISTLFSGAAMSVGIMAVTLEIGKLVTASYLFRFWSETKVWLRAYLSLAILILMIITSAGIFGYLSYAYQKSALEHKASNSQINFLLI